MSLRPFLPALVFGLITISLLVAALGYRPFRAAGREGRSVDQLLLGYAVVAAIVCAMLMVIGIAISEYSLSGFDPG
jgi:hypothetical protein